nr:MAG TPA: hypothetical protein [Herelleviridae sp.]
MSNCRRILCGNVKSEYKAPVHIDFFKDAS